MSNFDDFLKQESILNECEKVAIERVNKFKRGLNMDIEKILLHKKEFVKNKINREWEYDLMKYYPDMVILFDDDDKEFILFNSDSNNGFNQNDLEKLLNTITKLNNSD